MFERIMFAKIAWAKKYQGDKDDEPQGNFKDKRRYERRNFYRQEDGKYCGFVLPSASKKEKPYRPPETMRDWIVVFVAKKPKRKGVFIVGWYLHANFTEDYQLSPFGDKYCVEASGANLIPEKERDLAIPSGRMNAARVVYVRVNGQVPARKESWMDFFDEKIRPKLAAYETIGRAADAATKAAERAADPDHKARVEQNAIEAAEAHLKGLGYAEIVDRQKDNCGYDLKAKGSSNAENLHVEVKGKSAGDPSAIFLTANEYAMMKKDAKWRLLIVAGALNPLKDRRCEMLTGAKVEADFESSPLVWRIRRREKS